MCPLVNCMAPALHLVHVAASKRADLPQVPWLRLPLLQLPSQDSNLGLLLVSEAPLVAPKRHRLLVYFLANSGSYPI